MSEIIISFCCWTVRADKSEPSVLDNPTIVDQAKKYGKSSANVILRWLIQHNITVIPKSVTPARIQENIQVLILVFGYKFHYATSL